MSATAARITLIAPSLAAGGSERSVAELANGLVSAGWPTTLLSFTHPAADHFPLDDQITRQVVPFYSITRGWRRPFAALARLLRLRRAVRATAPDVVICLSDTVNVRLLLALLGSRIRVVVGVRTHPERMNLNPQQRWLRWLTYRWAAAVVVQTEGAAAWAREQGLHQVEVIPNPVPNWPRRSEPVVDGGRVVALGRLSAEKGFDQLLRAWRQLPDRPSAWRLELGGEGAAAAELQHLAAEDPSITFTGLVGDAQQFIAGAAVLVLPSRHEGFPNVLLEAMSLGVPVVAFDCEFGPRDIVRHDVDGLLVPAGDEVALGEALTLLLTDGDRRASLAARAPEVRQRFAPEANLQRWLTLLTNRA